MTASFIISLVPYNISVSVQRSSLTQSVLLSMPEELTPLLIVGRSTLL
ncbi:hypothetical protein VIBR0546_14490 [Vibrio brasiliensis LMG 20546]|uniref:Uncharacterized protein n=1 Tax=Vibrio brasiliensis LMG 20546 TaxID=945543 RepID=E8LVB7_9VIBR|nr:hypothetical protein VIBR0546_14490 [Vibrio brasiliensis LMG 20546]